MTDVTDIPHLPRTPPPVPEHAQDADTLSIRPIPALQDNYIWCIGRGRDFIVVDPGDAQPVLNALMPATAAANRPDEAAAPRTGTTAPRAKALPPQAEAATPQTNSGRMPASSAPPTASRWA